MMHTTQNVRLITWKKRRHMYSTVSKSSISGASKLVEKRIPTIASSIIESRPVCGRSTRNPEPRQPGA
eukprot:666221-Prymnesium_polylepis.1